MVETLWNIEASLTALFFARLVEGLGYGEAMMFHIAGVVEVSFVVFVGDGQ